MNKWLMLISLFLLFSVVIASENINDIDKLANECNLNNQEACRNLVKIIKNVKNDLEIRKKAIEVLSDQKLLFEILKYENSWVIHEAAIERINDQGILNNIIKTVKDCSIVIAAAERLNDQAYGQFVIANVAKNSKIYGCRVRAVEKLTDQKMLAEIAKKYSDIQADAVKKLIDTKALEFIIKNSKDCLVRRNAVENEFLTDQKLLEYVATNVKSDCMNDRESAISKMNNKTILTKIIIEEGYLGRSALKRMKTLISQPNSISEESDLLINTIIKYITAFDSVPIGHRERLMDDFLPFIRTINSKSVFNEIGEFDSLEVIWKEIKQEYKGKFGAGSLRGENVTFSIHFPKLNDSFTLAWNTHFNTNISTSTLHLSSFHSDLGFEPSVINSSDLLNDILYKIDNQAVIIEIANTDINTNNRIVAVDHITDQQALTALIIKIGPYAMYSEVQERAVNNINLTDQKLLAKIIKNDDISSKAREAAIEKITDNNLLIYIAKKDKSGFVRRKAVEKLIDPKILSQIAKKDEMEYVREAARKRLSEL